MNESSDRLFLCEFLVVGDYKEGYYIGVEIPEGDPEAEKPFYGPNMWPAPGHFINSLIWSKNYLDDFCPETILIFEYFSFL